MSDSTITCPNCQTPFEINQVIRTQIAGDLKAEMETELNTTRKQLRNEREKIAAVRQQLEAKAQAIDAQVKRAIEAEREALETKLKKSAQESVAVELKDRDAQVTELQTNLKAAQEKELTWRKQERALKKREDGLKQKEETLEAEAEKTLNEQREQLIAKAKAEVTQANATTLKQRDEQVSALEKRVKESQQNELDLRKREQELKQKSEEMELNVARQMDEERDKIRQAVLKQADEQQAFKAAEKDKKISDLVEQIDEMKRKMEQGSQQAQGEVMETALEDLLSHEFPHDGIVEVPKGISGGDVMQRVMVAGANCGLILWESKRTKNWQHQWLPKLRKDLRDAKASVAILVTAALPEGVEHFTEIDGVWVCSWSCVIGVAKALRAGLVEAAEARRALEGQHGKMEQVYNYLASPAFRNRVQGIVEAFVTMKEDLDKEKRAIQRQWAKREKQIEHAIGGTVGMYGDIQGIIGASLPEIDGLEMLAIEELESATAIEVSE